MVRDFPEMEITVKAGDLPDLAEKFASSDIEKKSAALEKMRNDYVDELNAFGEIVRLVRERSRVETGPFDDEYRKGIAEGVMRTSEVISEIIRRHNIEIDKIL